MLGIGRLRTGVTSIRWQALGKIGVGWIVTPLGSGLVCFSRLFLMRDILGQAVYL